MRVRVEVTAEDVARGKRCAWKECPVALALARALDCLVVVHPRFVRQMAAWWWQTCPAPGEPPLGGDLPPQAEAAARAYDATGRMSPFAFDLDVPEG